MSRLSIDWASRTGLLAIVLSVACEGTAFAEHSSATNGNAVTHWNHIATEILSVEAGPVIDSRAMSILHAAIHDAVNGIERRYKPYTADLSFPGASLDAAVASAGREVLITLAPRQGQRIEQEYSAANGTRTKWRR